MDTQTVNYQAYYQDQLQKDGIVLVENESSKPVNSSSYITSCLMIVLHKRGVLHVRYDLKEKTMTDRKVVILLPQHMVSAYWASEDFERTLIVISPRIFEQLKCTNSYRHHLLYHDEPECELSEVQWNSLLPGVALLRTILQSSSPNRDHMVVNCLDILFELLNSYNMTNRGDGDDTQAHRQLFTRFYELLIEHYKDSRDIGYYAERMFLTPKYFAKLIKQTTGISASDWIDNYVIMQAKTLMKAYPQWTIQQVAQQLGFAQQATFCRYFKTRVGLSPSEFRHGME